MLSREKFEEFFPELPVRVVLKLDKEEGKNNFLYVFKIKNKSKLHIADFGREGTALSVHDISSYEDFVKIEKEYERWQESGF